MCGWQAKLLSFYIGGLPFAGLELYENVLSPDEQTNMIHIIEDWVVQVSPVLKLSSGAQPAPLLQVCCSSVHVVVPSNNCCDRCNNPARDEEMLPIVKGLLKAVIKGAAWSCHHS